MAATKKRVHLNQSREVLFSFNSTGRTVRLASTEVLDECELEELDDAWVEAIEDVDPPAPKETEKKASSKKKRRAKKKDGTYVADDPATPDVNEAWEDGKGPNAKDKGK